MLAPPLRAEPKAPLAPPIFGRADGRAAGFAVSPGLVGYPEAVAAMEACAQAIAEGRSGELIWFLEHPPIYTAGVSAKAGDLLERRALPGLRHRAGRPASTPITGPASGWPM